MTTAVHHRLTKRPEIGKYATVICAWLAGNDAPEIARALALDTLLVSAWIVNFLSLDRVA